MNPASQLADDEGVLHFGSFDGRFVGITMTLTDQTLAALDLTSADAVDQFHDVAHATVHSHELRHFHDFLLSPRGSITLRQRIVEVLNAMSLLARTKRLSEAGSVNALPVPLGRWADLDASARREFLAPLAQLVGELHVPDVPHIPLARRLGLRPVEPEQEPESDAEWFQSAVHAVLLARARLHDALRDDEGWGFTSQQIREGGAFCIQLQEAWTAFGEDAVDALEAHTKVHAPSYLTAQHVWQLASGNYNIDSAAAALTWSQLGAYSGGRLTSPAVRFGLLIASTSRDKTPTASGAGISDFDAATGSADTFGVLQSQLDEDERFLRQLKDRTQPDTDESAPAELVNLFSEFLAAKRRVVELVCEDASLYLEPLKYLETVERLPSPPLRMVSTPGGAIDVTHLGDQAKDIIRRGGETADGRIGATELLIQIGDDVNVETASVACDLFQLADVLLDEDLRDLDSSALDLLQQQVPGVRLLNVLA